MSKVFASLLGAWSFSFSPTGAEPLPRPVDLAPLLQPILEKSQLPSLGAALIDDAGIKAIGAVGVRKRGDESPVEITDKYHLGSCTKPMTATLTAVLVEEGLLRWDTTIAEVLQDEMSIHRDFQKVTVEQLLTHVGGLATQCPPPIWKQAFQDQGRLTPTQQRFNFAKALLQEPPAYPPGTKATYSNQGYAVVGVMLETVSKKPWEKLLREKLFDPLGMSSAGFREPASVGKNIDQPWGHLQETPVAPGPLADNPDAIGPAGTVHASLADWAKFAQFHLNQKTGKVLQKAESFEKLNTTLENSGKYGVGGWLVQNEKRFGGHFLQMTGSNTMWFALLWILPGQNKAVLVTTNAAPQNAFQSCDKVVARLLALP